MANEVGQLLDKAKAGFDTISVGEQYRVIALNNLQTWLTEEQFADYVPQLKHCIQQGSWDYLLDCFYQVIPFGTGGRRGEVGIGPNRINPYTIKASAQGHSQYLIKAFGEEAKTRGIAFTYDVRQFFTNRYFDDALPNPIRDLTSKDLTIAAAEVYAANGILVTMYDDVRTTPQLSFTIRHLHCVSGAMFSASHNPPAHNGKKVYDEFGGQLIPPADEALVTEVTEGVSQIKQLDYQSALKQGLIRIVGEEVDQAYIEAITKISLSQKRDVKIAFTPLHGCADTSVLKALLALGFSVKVDPKTSNPSGKFENVTFNIPNPEVIESFDTPLLFAKQIQADILLNADPDADRIGIMAFHKGTWHFINGNEIAAICTEYALSKRKEELAGKGVVIKTGVTTNLLVQICKENDCRIIGDLLVGFKYIGSEMNKLEAAGEIDNFVLGCEESHGYIAGNYVRDKDAAVAAVWLAEVAAELKEQGKTLIDYLDAIYEKYGFFRNYLTEIRMLGATGAENIRTIQKHLRTEPPAKLGKYSVRQFEDCQQRLPIVSETDRMSKDVLIYDLEPPEGVISMKVTIRPSGTEPKSKVYFEIGGQLMPGEKLDQLKVRVELLLNDLEKDVLQSLYKIIGIDFPDRGFLLFWQLPLSDKMKYFEIEPKIAALKDEADITVRKGQLSELLAFLGADPIEKVDRAFTAEYGQSVRDYLQIVK